MIRTIKLHKIPTLIALIILVMGVATSVFVVQNKTTLFGQASNKKTQSIKAPPSIKHEVPNANITLPKPTPVSRFNLSPLP